MNMRTTKASIGLLGLISGAFSGGIDLASRPDKSVLMIEDNDFDEVVKWDKKRKLHRPVYYNPNRRNPLEDLSKPDINSDHAKSLIDKAELKRLRKLKLWIISPLKF